ncbi:hypothetical protein SS50377_20577 [Spironucleus salmonicida]|uniref:Uncharacterized protein n=1 Tax=Spironucleus salmonicida TaxID=348837 RepID=V6LUC1_9EUKA|nr:hypothetical protein SS50377_20577 [Spironucleus salmonicida]|eukprot:EST48165.1 Hypothetical protein SS50377_11683 [Spironucleus salmonicida]
MALATLLQNCNFNTNLDAQSVRPYHNPQISVNAQTTPSLNQRQRSIRTETTPDPDFQGQNFISYNNILQQQQNQHKTNTQWKQVNNQYQQDNFNNNFSQDQQTSQQHSNSQEQKAQTAMFNNKNQSNSAYQLQISQITQLLTFEQEKSNQYLDQLNNQKQENQAMQNEILRLQAQNLKAEKEHSEQLSLFREKSSSANDLQMKLDIALTQVKQLSIDLKKSESKLKKNEKATQELIQLIQENSPALGKQTKIRTQTIAKKPLNKESDRAQKVLISLKNEQNLLKNDLNLIFDEAKHAPEVIGETDVVDLYRKMKNKQQCVKDLNKYRKQVQKLGVLIK